MAVKYDGGWKHGKAHYVLFNNTSPEPNQTNLNNTTISFLKSMNNDYH